MKSTKKNDVLKTKTKSKEDLDVKVKKSPKVLRDKIDSNKNITESLIYEDKITSNLESKKKLINRKNVKSKDISKTLVIVESPSKAKTIEKYLGPKFSVLASMGHLIDLPKSRLAINIEKKFEPEYLTIRGKAKLLKDLQKAAQKSKNVLLASDNDREGEAIAFHIQNSLKAKSNNLNIERIVFNEITPLAIREAIKHSRPIDLTKVNAQKARRILDRLVGYNLSPLLWAKVKNGLSAGRVQSVALRLICEREKEVEAYYPIEYWTVSCKFKKGRGSFLGELTLYKNEKIEIKNKKDADSIIEKVKNNAAIVRDIKESEKSIRAKPPFTTSKLQQNAASRLGFTGRKTMQVAQQLYEGVKIGSMQIGLITYMRTDSTRVSETAIKELREYLKQNFPAELPDVPNSFGVNEKAQDAHEAIRPTMLSYTPEKIAKSLSSDQLKLYTLIWEQFVASQMNNAKNRSMQIEIEIGDAIFKTSYSRLIESGFYKVLKLNTSKDENKTQALPELKIKEKLQYTDFYSEQHFTQGPSRYSDSSIVKVLEELGIGRPSTYAPIISVLLDRYYITRENKQFKPTTLGRMISDILVESFPKVLDAGFTASLEKQLDAVEEDKVDWVGLIGDFWFPFKEQVDNVMESLQSYRGSFDETTDKICEKCGKPMIKKLGRFGFFLACSGFPECRNTKSVPLAPCPKVGCGGEIVARKKTKGRGKEFYGCTRYPDCDFISYQKPSNSKCPKCSWFLVEKTDRKTGSHKACINPDCDYLHTEEKVIKTKEA